MARFSYLVPVALTKWGLTPVVGWLSMRRKGHATTNRVRGAQLCARRLFSRDYPRAPQENGRNARSAGLLPENIVPTERAGDREQVPEPEEVSPRPAERRPIRRLLPGERRNILSLTRSEHRPFFCFSLFFFISYIDLTKNFSTILVLLFRFRNELFALPASFIVFIVLIPVKSRV